MEYSQITPQLFVGNQPDGSNYQHLHELGIRLLINMRYESAPTPDPINPPIPVLWLRTIDSPFFPLPIRLLSQGAEEALKVMADGGKVYVHCAHGVHRGPAMAACILIAQGWSVDEAIALIRQNRPIADPGIFYIRWRINRFAQAWEKRHT